MPARRRPAATNPQWIRRGCRVFGGEVRPTVRVVPHWAVFACFLALVAAAPALLVVALDGRPVRIGVPLPAAAVASGLRLEGKGTL
jgi:hypothetical protein